MMDYRMNGNSKLCGTCEFWTGPRQPDTFGATIILADQHTSGKCWCLNGPHARGERFSNNTTCFCYEKWKVLR